MTADTTLDFVDRNQPAVEEGLTAGPAAAGSTHHGAALRVVPLRHPSRWVASAVIVVLLAMFVHGLVTNPQWDWDIFFQYFTADSILKALRTTLWLTLWGTVIGFSLGTVLAAMRLSKSPLLQAVSWTYTWLFRSIPLIVNLLFWYNLAYLYKTVSFGIPFGPSLREWNTLDLLSPMAAAIIGLAVHQSAYSAEVMRSGLLAVDHGQREAAAALGIPRGRQSRRIVLPQAMRTILPTGANEVINLFKSTSVVYVMAIGELFYQVRVIYNRNGAVWALLMVATVWYLVLTTVLSIIQYYVERHFARGNSRQLPPTPLQRLRRSIASIAARAKADDARVQEARP
ncbi:MAG: amino acid ABC transporter permease [Actinobacteria bacterium]|nr:amino acid ABC transporter permease [Actinomycetota bacterium]